MNMLKKIFDSNNVFFSFMGKIYDLILLNFLFIITSLPLITVGASISALYKCLYMLTSNSETSLIKMYFESFRSTFKKSTLYFGVMILVATLIALNFLSLNYISGNMRSIYLVINIIFSILIFGIFSYGFVFISWYGCNFKKTILNSFLVTVGSLPWLILIIAISILPLTLILSSNISLKIYSAPLFLLFGISFIAYVKAILFKQIFKKYTNLETISEDV